MATNGHADGRAKASNGNGAGTVTLSLGTTNVAFKIQEDAPSCAECGSIMVRNGSCYKCLNCGSHERLQLRLGPRQAQVVQTCMRLPPDGRHSRVRGFSMQSVE